MYILNVTAQKPHSTGSGFYMTEMIRAFQKAGHTGAVIAGLYREDTAEFPEGFSFHPVYFHTPQLPFSIYGMSDEMPYPACRYRDMTPENCALWKHAFAAVLQETVRKRRPDIIICHHLYLLTALVREMLPDIPVYGICHGSDLRQLRTNSLAREYIAEQIRHLDRVCCLHGEQAEEVQRYFHIPARQLRVVGSGFNDEIFYDREPSGGTPGGLKLVYAGKISEKKGVYSLLRAIVRPELADKKISLTMAGGWSQDEQKQKAEALAEAAEQAGCRVELTGPLQQGLLAERFRQGDIFVLPSFYEGLPLVLAEAMACGMRVVCTDLPGIREWMDANVPDHQIVFVRPPVMEEADTPKDGELPAFERRLAEGIVRAAALPEARKDLSRLSWKGVCEAVADP